MASEQEIERIVVRVMGDVSGALKAFGQVQAGVKEMGTGTARGVDEILKEMDRLNREIAAAQAGGQRTKLGGLLGEREGLRGEAAAVSQAIQAKKEAEAKVADEIAEQQSRQNDIRWEKEIVSERKYLRMKEDMEEAADLKAHDARIKQREKEFQIQQKMLDAQIDATIREIESDNKKKADEEQRVRDRFSNQRIDQNVSMFQRAEQIKLGFKAETSKKIDKLEELDLLKSKGFLTEKERAQAESAMKGQKGMFGPLEAILADFNRRQIMRVSAGVEGGIGVIGSSIQHTLHGTDLTAKETLGHINAAAGGIIGGLSPVVGAVVGAIGGALTAVVGMFEDLFMHNTRAARKMFDEIVSGSKTTQQALASARIQGLEETMRSYARIQDMSGGERGVNTAAGGITGVVAGSMMNEQMLAENANDIRRHLQERMNDPNWRNMLRRVTTARAQTQMDEQSTQLTNQGARGGMSQQDAQRLQMVQDLAARSTMSLGESYSSLNRELGLLRVAQTAAAFGEAATQSRNLTVSLEDQFQNVGRTADYTERYRITMEYARAASISFADAQNALAVQLGVVQQAQAGTALAQLNQAYADAISQGGIAIGRYREFAQTVQGSLGSLNEATTTDASIQRQDRMMDLARRRADVERQIVEASASGFQRRQDLEGQRAGLQERIANGNIVMRPILQAQLVAVNAQLAGNNALTAAERERLLIQRNALNTNMQNLGLQDMIFRQLELQRDALAQGHQLMIQMRSPLENYEASLGRIEALRRRNAVDPVTRQRAAAAEVDRLEAAAGGPDVRMVAGMTFGSAAAISAINRYRNAQEDRQESPAERLLRIQTQALQMQVDQARVGRLILDAMQAQQANLAAGRVVTMLGLALR